MKRWAALWVAVCAVGLQGQAPELERHSVVAAKPNGLVSAPAPMKVPEKLDPPKPPNANVLYLALRGRTPNGPSFSVKDLKLRRDAGVFTFSSGTVTLFSEVNGKVTGAVFVGEGSLHVEPPSAMEKRQLKAVMKTEVLDQRFTTAVLAFTDGTGAELRKGAGGDAAPTGEVNSLAHDMQTLFRSNLRYDLEERLLEDVEQPGPATGGFFLASIKGPMFSKRLIYVVDPHGAVGVAPEEVGLLTSGDEGFDVTLGFNDAVQRKLVRPADNTVFKIPQQTIDATIERNGKLTATSVTAVMAVRDGVRVIPLQLFPTLRVSGVWGANGEALDFIQEDKLHDADFAILLSKPLAAGESVQLTTSYAGRDAVASEGNNNYFLVAREDWYPNKRGEFGNYAQYTMTFHTAKEVQVVATGDRVSEHDDAKQKTSVWQTTSPIPVAGFNLGAFKMDQSERNKDVQVISYANSALAGRYAGIADSGMPLGTMSTTGMLKRATSEGDAAVQIYTDMFGPLPYDHISLTQQTACNFGQSWPTLVYLPICYFWDSTIQHELGLLDTDPTYWNVVTAHEVAHQWWGQTVGFASYRDQWMSEGFANFSASIFLLRTHKTNKEYRDFWALLHKRLLEKNAQGFRPNDVGPVVMGARVSTSRTGEDVYQNLVYSKGAYILHMLEMMFFDPKYGDQPFKVAMHDFVATYRNQPASTEDFKAVMEKHMVPRMDLDHNGKLDWFFNAYVYGTEVPTYTVTYDFSKRGDDTVMHFKVVQSGVSEDFEMLVPVYVEWEDKRVTLLGRGAIRGSSAMEQTVNLGKAAVAPKRVEVNYHYDLLAN